MPIQVYWPGHEGQRDWLLFTAIPDFVYEKDGFDVYEDTKGRVLNEFRIKKKAVRMAHGIDIVIVTRPRTKNAPWIFDKVPEAKRYYTE